MQNNLAIPVTSPAKVLIYYIMARSTKSYAITNCVSKIWIFSPRFNMMNNSLSQIEESSAVLASKIISSKTSVSPLNIKDIITPLNIMPRILFSISSLSLTLLGVGRFIRACSRAEPSFGSVIRVYTEWFGASLADFIVVHNQYKDYSI